MLVDDADGRAGGVGAGACVVVELNYNYVVDVVLFLFAANLRTIMHLQEHSHFNILLRRWYLQQVLMTHRLHIPLI